jgi:hypothetical protein
MRAIPSRIGLTSAVLLSAMLVACGSDDDGEIVGAPASSRPG